MGGHALKSIQTVRLNSPDFYALVNELLPKVKEIFQTEVHLSQCYQAKDNHGDMDLLLLNDGSDKFQKIKALIEENFHPTEIFPNDGVYSFDYKNFQIDLILIPKNNWEIAKAFYAYDPIPNLVGKISYRMGVKFGPDGFRFMYRTEEGSEYGEILLTKDPRKIYEFLDFDYSKIESGFDTLEDIYEFMISSKYFSADIYQYDNLRHIDRKRNLRRKSYNEFLKFINDNADKLPNYVFNEDKTSYIPMLAEAFPEAKLYEKIAEMKEKERIHKDIASKFNGHLIMERFPKLIGKELGNAMFNFKAKFENFNEYCLTHTQEEVMNEFALFHNKIIASERDAEIFFSTILDENQEPNEALKDAFREYKKSQSSFEGEYFQSDEFQKGFEEQVKKDTWEKGLPMVYRNDEGQIVKHWKDGRIEIIK